MRAEELCVVDLSILHQPLIRSQVESVGEGVTSVSVVRLRSRFISKIYLTSRNTRATMSFPSTPPVSASQHVLFSVILKITQNVANASSARAERPTCAVVVSICTCSDGIWVLTSTLYSSCYSGSWPHARRVCSLHSQGATHSPLRTYARSVNMPHMLIAI